MIEETRLPESVMAELIKIIPGPEPPLEVRIPRIPVVEEPATRRIIPVSDPRLDGNELRYLTQCIQSNWISSAGRFVREFEEKFAAAMGCRYGIACSNGTTALHLALAALGLRAGDEVIIPTFTMIATANAVHYTGAVPVLVDAERDTWNLDVGQLADRITPRTRGILLVHTYGHPCDMNAILLCGSAHPTLGDAVAAELDLAPASRTLGRFPDGELCVLVHEPVRGADVYLLQPLSPPADAHLLELLFLADACRRGGAKRVTAILPYLAWARQERRRAEGEPHGARLAADLLSLRVDRVLAVDVHDEHRVARELSLHHLDDRQRRGRLPAGRGCAAAEQRSHTDGDSSTKHLLQ